MAISKRTRYEVLRRDNHTCRYCHATDTPLTIDHVIPTALGGTDDPSNLVAACKDCNAGKTSTSPDAALVAAVSDDAVRWSAAMKLAAERLGVADEAMESRLVGLGDYWYAAIPRYNHGKPKWRLPSDWRIAVAGLLNAGLPDAVVFDCIDIAVNGRGNVDNAFRYMLGVANNKLAKLQEEAQAILAAGTPQPEPVAVPSDYDKGYAACWAMPEVSYGVYSLAWAARVTDNLVYNITLADA